MKKTGRCNRCTKKASETVWTRFGAERLCAGCAFAVKANGLAWEPARVGCHWSKDGFSISTYQQGAEGGYCLYRDERGEIGRFDTFQQAAEAAARYYLTSIPYVEMAEVMGNETEEATS